MKMWNYLAFATMAVFAGPASAATFLLTSSDVDIEQPSPLFTSSTVSGTLTLADTVLPGQSFSSADLQGVQLNFAGITGNLGSGPVKPLAEMMVG